MLSCLLTASLLLAAPTELPELRTGTFRTNDNANCTCAADPERTRALDDSLILAYPASARHWTGNVRWLERNPQVVNKHDNLSGYGRYNDRGDYWRVLGWMKFDLSTIPDTIAVVSVALNYFQFSSLGEMAHCVRLLSVDPVEAGGDTFRYCLGIEVSPFRSDTVDNVWIERELNTDGVAAVESCLVQDWAALAFVGQNEGEGTGRLYGYASGTWRPFLTITYDPRGAINEERHAAPEPQVLLFPNPASHRAGISYSLPPATASELSVPHISGREVWTRRLAGERSGTLQLPLLPAGVYVVRLESSSFTATEKLVVQR